MAKKRRMAYLPPALDADLMAMADELKGSNVNELIQTACELLVQGWRAGHINDRAELLFNVEVVKASERLVRDYE